MPHAAHVRRCTLCEYATHTARFGESTVMIHGVVNSIANPRRDADCLTHFAMLPTFIGMKTVEHTLST